MERNVLSFLEFSLLLAARAIANRKNILNAHAITSYRSIQIDYRQTFSLGELIFEPHNPRTTPTKTMMNIASAILGVVYIVLFS